MNNNGCKHVFVVTGPDSIDKLKECLVELYGNDLGHELYENYQHYLPVRFLYSFGGKLTKKIDSKYKTNVSKSIDEIYNKLNAHNILMIDSGGFQSLTGRLNNDNVDDYIDQYNTWLKENLGADRNNLLAVSLDVPPCTKDNVANGITPEQSSEYTGICYQRHTELSDEQLKHLYIVWHITTPFLAQEFKRFIVDETNLIQRGTRWSASPTRRYGYKGSIVNIGAEGYTIFGINVAIVLSGYNTVNRPINSETLHAFHALGTASLNNVITTCFMEQYFRRILNIPSFVYTYDSSSTISLVSGNYTVFDPMNTRVTTIRITTRSANKRKNIVHLCNMIYNSLPMRAKLWRYPKSVNPEYMLQYLDNYGPIFGNILWSVAYGYLEQIFKESFEKYSSKISALLDKVAGVIGPELDKVLTDTDTTIQTVNMHMTNLILSSGIVQSIVNEICQRVNVGWPDIISSIADLCLIHMVLYKKLDFDRLYLLLQPVLRRIENVKPGLAGLTATRYL